MMRNIATRFSFALLIVSVALLAACSINVDDKDKKNEKVDIQTPFAKLKVNTSDKAADNGIPVYPGAHCVQQTTGTIIPPTSIWALLDLASR